MGFQGHATMRNGSNWQSSSRSTGRFGFATAPPLSKGFTWWKVMGGFGGCEKRYSESRDYLDSGSLIQMGKSEGTFVPPLPHFFFFFLICSRGGTGLVTYLRLWIRE